METAAISRSRGRKRPEVDDRRTGRSVRHIHPPVVYLRWIIRARERGFDVPYVRVRFSQFIVESLPFDGGRAGSPNAVCTAMMTEYLDRTGLAIRALPPTRGTSMTATAPITASLWQFRLSESPNETASGAIARSSARALLRSIDPLHKYVWHFYLALWCRV